MSTRYKFHRYSQDEINRYYYGSITHNHHLANFISLQGIALPAKLKCGRCSKNLPQARFSAKQLNDARRQIKESCKVNKPISCQSCTGQQVVEIECTMCGKTKGLEEFAKSQRRNPDTAKCYQCVEMILAQDAIEEDKYEDPDKAFVTPNHSNGTHPEYFSAAVGDKTSSYGEDDWKSVNENHGSKRKVTEDGGIALSADFQRAISLLGSADENLINSEYAHPAGQGRSSNDGWSEVHTKSWHTQSSRATSTTSTLSPNPQPRSGTSIAGSARTFASSVAERSTTSGLRPNGWAKIPAAPGGPPIVSASHTQLQA